MLQNPCKTLGFKKNMVYKIPPGGGGKPYPASGLKNGAVFDDAFLLQKISPDVAFWSDIMPWIKINIPLMGIIMSITTLHIH